jgi:diguanylate cyclase
MDAALTTASVEAGGSSVLIFIGLAAALVEMLLGVALGWWLRGGKKSPPPASPHELRQAESALTSLHELAHRVKADVGAHSSQVEAISNELSAQKQNGSAPETKVLSAVTKILEANERLSEQLQTAESKLVEQAEEIKLHATHAMTDALTGLGNRRALDHEIARRIAEFHRYGTPFTLLMLDVDHFKKFNDTHGHLAGDEVLRLVGRILQSAVRTEDFVARYGGEEFAILATQTALTDALAAAERVRSSIEKGQCQFEGKKLHVAASVGLAQMAAGHDAVLLIQAADQALYAAKQNGRNQVQMFIMADESSDLQSTTVNVPPSKPSAPAKRAPTDGRTDLQTGLPNRTAFCEDIRRRLAETKRHGNRLSIILVKVDNLNQHAADHGTPIQELILRTCTQFLSAAMRDMDLVARHDTDSFAIALPGTAVVYASAAAERLRAAIQRCPLQLHDQKFCFTVSAGAAECVADEDLIAFMSRAEEALQTSVSRGGNRVHFHTGNSIERVPEQVAVGE